MHLLKNQKNLTFSILAGVLFSWSIQLIRTIHFNQRTLSEVWSEYSSRLIISGIIGAVVFAFFHWLIARISADNTRKHLQMLLLQFNIFIVYVLLLGDNPTLFYALLGIITLSSLLRLIIKDFWTKSLSSDKRKELIAASTIIAYFSVIHLLYCAETDTLTLIKTFFSLSFLALPVLIFNRGKIIYLSLLILILLLFTVPLLYHMKTFDAPMPQGVYFAIFESPSGESLEYISTYLTLDIIAQILLVLLMPVSLLFFIGKTRMPWKEKMLTQGGIIIIVLIFILSFANKNYQNNVLHNYISNLEKYRNEYKIFREELAKRQTRKVVFEKLSVADSANVPYPDEETYVMIIGESTDRNHMSLFGYYRNTNPMLESIKNELFLFRDVISPHSHTQPSLRKALTFANFEDMTPFYKEGSMIEMFKQAGYKTYWLSNQHFAGEFENAITAMAMVSDKYIFVNDDDKKEGFDGGLIKPLKKVLQEKVKKKFIIVHLLGTHGNYVDRYPSSFNIFSENTKKDIRVNSKPFLKNSDYGRDRINEYDNAVRYNDKVVYDIIQTVKKNAHFAFVLYFSDHGEEVYDCMPYCSHQEANATAFMFEIPFLLWCSPEYIKINKKKVNQFPQYIHRKYQTDDVIHSMIDLSNLTLKNYVPSKSIFNAAFIEEKRIMNEQDYDMEKQRFSIYKMVLQKNIDPKNMVASGKGNNSFDEMKKMISENKNWIRLLEDQAERDNISLDSALNAETRWALGQ
ncbi:MAG: phosphoethanolamine transferase [Flavobacteriales bacterium]